MVHYGGMLYVFGGNNKRAGKRHVLADLCAFDLAQSKWRLLNDGFGAGESPIPYPMPYPMPYPHVC
jgi:hypothetical protein